MSALSQPAVSDSPLGHHRLGPERLTVPLETSDLDDREYRFIRLDNKLEVLLVHDAHTDKASAAMSVDVGHFSDDKDMPGTAHAVEHLVFLGTKKYPEENAYTKYLAEHSGKHNAFTHTTITTFHFEITAQADKESELSPLYGALDRFAQFFIEPLFLSSAIDRELRAVDSEHHTDHPSDSLRIQQLQKWLSNPDHPWSKFENGTYDSLKTEPEARGINIRQYFMEFYKKYYSANRMKLVVLGQEPLDLLEEWVADIFAGVEDKNLPPNHWETEVPLPPKYLLTQCLAVPIMDWRWMDLEFPFLDETSLFESQPSKYLEHIIGHQGPGSLFSSLKNKGWVTHLFTSVDPVCPGTPGIFLCRMQFTKEGMKKWEDAMVEFFRNLSALQREPPQEEVFDELKKLGDYTFKFEKKTSATSFTNETSLLMQTPLPKEWLLSGYSRLRKFEPARIEEAWACFRPDNFRITLVSQHFKGECDQKEKWHGTEYTNQKISSDLLAKINYAWTGQPRPEFHLPHKNPFIPTRFELKEQHITDSAAEPRIIRNDDIVRTWYKADFREPRANLFIHCRNTIPYATAENAAKTTLYIGMVRDLLEEYLHDTKLVKYKIETDSTGITMRVYGSDEFLPVLLEKVLNTLRHLEVKTDRFQIVKEKLSTMLQNSEFSQPWYQAYYLGQWLSGGRDYMNEQIVAEFPHLTADDVQQFCPGLLGQMYIEIFAHGSLYKEEALELSVQIERTLQPRALPQNQWLITRSLVFSPGDNYVYRKTLKDPDTVNHCIEYLLYVGVKSHHPTKAKALLLEQMMREPIFDRLRTKEQHGYVVLSGARMTTTTITYRIAIEGEKTPEDLERRIDSFLTSYAEIMREMPDSEFETHKRSSIMKCLEKPHNPKKGAKRHWSEIKEGSFDFERGSHDAAQIKELIKEEMIEFYRCFILPSSITRSKIAIHLTGPTHTKTGTEVVTAAVGTAETTVEGNNTNPFIITDVRDFKSKMLLSPGPQPVKHVSEFE